MPTAKRYELTWDKRSKRWKKYKDGKQYYLSPRGGRKDDWAAYQTALRKWEGIKVELNNANSKQAEWDGAIEQRERMMAWAIGPGRSHPDTEDLIRSLTAELEQLRTLQADGADINESPIELNMMAPLDFTTLRLWSDRFQTVENSPTGMTTEQAVTEFIEFKTGTVGGGRLYNINDALKEAMKSLPPVLTEINAYAWERLSTFLRNNYTSNRGADVQAMTAQFLDWCYASDRLPVLPKNIKSDHFKIKRQKRKPNRYTADEVTVVLANSKPREELWWLLMLNCGFTQMDVAALSPDEIDWDAGTITRKRTKLEDNDSDSVPTVIRHLWPRTLELLKQHANREGVMAIIKDPDKPIRIALTNEDGGALVYRYTDPQTGKMRRTDALYNIWKRGFASIVPKGKTVKTFRKTGATILGGKKEFRSFRELYLGNAPRGTTDTSYDGTEELPAEITEYIGKELGLL